MSNSLPALPHLSLRWRRRVAFGVLALLYAAHAWLIYGLQSGGWDGPVWSFLAAAGLGGSAVLGLWTALGERPLWLRLPNALLILVSVVAVFFWMTTRQPTMFLIGLARAIVFAFHASSFVAALAIFSVLRWWRKWRLVPLERAGLDLPPPRAQIRLWVIFLEILLAAIVMALLRLAPREYWEDLWEPDTILAIGMMTLCLVPLQLPAVPMVALVLGDRRRGKRYYGSLIFAECLLLAAGSGTVWYLASDQGDFAAMAIGIGSAYLGVGVTLLAVRVAGFRLIARRALQVTAKPAAPTVAT